MNKENNNSKKCSQCNSENVFGISRVVGYFSKIDNWNNSKKAELIRRQKGNYWIDKKCSKFKILIMSKS